MIPRRIPGATRYLGAPKGWDPNEHGDCCHLSIADIVLPPGLNAMRSRWEPTPAELEILNAGGSIELTVLGHLHPPVWLEVRKLDAEGDGG